MSKLPINEIQALALCKSFLAQVEVHEAIWRKLGGFWGLGLLHNDAACLIEWWREVSETCEFAGMTELDHKFYILGFIVFLAGLEAVCMSPIRAICRRIEAPVPRFYLTLAISFHAEIQAAVRTLVEAYRPDIIAFAGENI